MKTETDWLAALRHTTLLGILVARQDEGLSESDIWRLVLQAVRAERKGECRNISEWECVVSGLDSEDVLAAGE